MVNISLCIDDGKEGTRVFGLEGVDKEVNSNKYLFLFASDTIFESNNDKVIIGWLEYYKNTLGYKNVVLMPKSFRSGDIEVLNKEAAIKSLETALAKLKETATKEVKTAY